VGSCDENWALDAKHDLDRRDLIQERSRGGAPMPPLTGFAKASTLPIAAYGGGYLLGAFLTGGFFSPPLGLISAR